MDDYRLAVLFSVFCFKAISRLEEQKLTGIEVVAGVGKRLLIFTK